MYKGELIMTYDNGLTKEQQAEVDAKYEELMECLKIVNPLLYKTMQKQIMDINNPKGIIADNNNQIEMIF
tara:strand:- start:64 stop:273 length:210 start_codon:yes stop_codon:yes gene_type:complete